MLLPLLALLLPAAWLRWLGFGVVASPMNPPISPRAAGRGAASVASPQAQRPLRVEGWWKRARALMPVASRHVRGTPVQLSALLG
jgi:hypothetical protein